jgi:hypothetical protein
MWYQFASAYLFFFSGFGGFLAIERRLVGESLLLRVLALARPPWRPSSTAAGFFFGGSIFSVSLWSHQGYT